MRIGINAFPLRNNGGGARYVFTGLLDAMLRVDTTNTYVIFAHLEGLRLIHQVVRSQSNLPEVESRVRVIEVTDESQINGWQHEIDVLFGPLNNLKPRLYDRPTVAILHDIQEQYFPEYFAKSDLIGRNEEYPEICHAATTLIAISQFCKHSFVEKFDVDPRKIEVVYNAPQARLVDRDSADQGYWGRPPLPEKFLFYPANNYPHKNHALLLDAIQQMQRDGDAIAVVLSGHEVLGGYPLLREITARGLAPLCHRFTELSPDEMRYLYCHAQAVVLPTVFEGFGMPAVEALACGCPLICTDLPSLREVAGDDALYFPAHDRDALLRQIRRVLADPSIAEAVRRGAASVIHRFNWTASAQRVLDILRQASRRFRLGYGDSSLRRRPRIGVLIRLSQEGHCIVDTTRSLIAAGYPDLVVRVVGTYNEQIKLLPFLESLDAKYVAVNLKDSNDVELLRDFARQDSLDLVVEANEGQTFRATAFDSVAWAANEQPDKLVYLGEAMEWRNGHLAQVARMRLTGDGLWKLEGFLHPESLFVRPEALPTTPGMSHSSRPNDDIHWRWELIRRTRQSNQLMLMRRTLADCDTSRIGVWSIYKAARAGMFNFYKVDGDTPIRVKFLRRFEPTIKAAARMLPMKWQDRGTRVWYRLAR